MAYRKPRVKRHAYLPEGVCQAVEDKHVACYDQFSLPVRTENRGGSEVEEILTAVHRKFGGCAHRCAGKPKCRGQDQASPRRRGHAQSGTAKG